MATQNNHTPELPDKKPKGGRPAKTNGEKKKLISVYFTDKERDKILQEAKGTPMSLYIHNQAIHGKVVEPISKELADALKDCSGMSNNLNQLTMKTVTLSPYRRVTRGAIMSLFFCVQIKVQK